MNKRRRYKAKARRRSARVPRIIGIDWGAGESFSMWRCVVCSYATTDERDIVEHYKTAHPLQWFMLVTPMLKEPRSIYSACST